MNKNILIALALIILVAGGGYYLWQNTATDVREPVTEVEDNEYHSAQYGISFSYPDTYNVTELDDGSEGKTVHAILLTDKDFVAAPYPEGPPSIGVSIQENKENLSVEDWVNANYNFTTEEGVLRPTMVGGVEAVSYTDSGLYEMDIVVVAYGGRIYMFSAGWMDSTDQIRTDFRSVLDSVEFVAS